MTIRSQALRLLAISLFAGHTVACGEITFPLTLATEGDNFIDITIPANGTNTQTTFIDGGVEATLFAEFNLFDLIFQNPILGVLQFDDLLFAGTEFAILNVPTGAVCIGPDPLISGGGTTTIDIFDQFIAFDAQLATVIEVEEPFIANQFPGGLPFPIDISSTAPFSLLDLIGLLAGTGSGLAVSQDIDEIIEVPIFGFPIPTLIQGTFTLGTANALPSSPELDFCETLLSGV